MTVTAGRADERVGDTPASVAVLPRSALEVTAAPTIDDAFRQVVGFSLFRRTGSQTANPTVQGVSLRGLGASGASRSLVLLDGLPLNDPFGGWVYWGRAPRLAVERLEVLRGGSSDLYGSGALGGVAQILTRPPGPGRGLRAEASAGGSALPRRRGHRPRLPGRMGRAPLGRGPPHRRLPGGGPVGAAGSIDRAVASRHGAVDATVERRLGGGGRAFVRGMYYDEARENGTPLQQNDTWIGLVAGGYDRGPWSFRLWGSTQELQQAFTAVAPDRESERLTRRQEVPAAALGAFGQWGRALGDRHRLVAGVEGRLVRGTTHETGYFGGSPSSRLEAGGEQLSGAVFVEDHLQLHPRWLLTAAGRLDVWSQRDGRSVLTPLVPRARPRRSPCSRPARRRPSAPGSGLLFRATSSLSLTPRATAPSGGRP